MGDLAGVLVDMDGTLLDSEKVWDVALEDLAAELGGSLTPPARQSMIGSSLWRSIEIIHADLGIVADPIVSAQFLTDRTSELFRSDLVWKPGARELLVAIQRERLPIALVTSTYRGLTETALDFMGRAYFAATVCGDEVDRPKPAPDPYLRAAELLGVAVTACAAIEDSELGTTSAELAGCGVLVVPSEAPVKSGPRRTIIDSLVDVDVALLHKLV
jgi:HAD superfamily hydrolase (TIGR01509 family)